jgi:hypothetical protein
MRPAALLAVIVAVVIFGCGKRAPRGGPVSCELLTKSDVQSIQGSPVANVKETVSSAERMQVTQCFYNTAEPMKSVSLSITQSAPNEPDENRAIDYWEKVFSKFGGKKREDERKDSDASVQQRSGGEREGSDEAEAEPPRKVEDLRDEAFWSGNRMGGSLYVLSKSRNLFIRVNVAGPEKPETKLAKCKALALKVLQKL